MRDAFGKVQAELRRYEHALMVLGRGAQSAASSGDRVKNRGSA